MTPYISEAARLALPMGQFERWFGKLFYYGGPTLGWRYIGPRTPTSYGTESHE